MAATEVVSDGMLNALVGTFFVNLVFQGAMSYLVSFINSLQLLIHLPLFNIVIPGNVNHFLKILVPVTQFDILDSSWTTEKIFEFDEEEIEEKSQDITDQTKDLGYETHNSVLNLGSISFLYFVKIGILLLPLKLFRRFKMANALYKKLLSFMIFSEILELNFDGYLEITIAGALSYQETFSEKHLARNLEI
jgi:hypothetical protein